MVSRIDMKTCLVTEGIKRTYCSTPPILYLCSYSFIFTHCLTPAPFY
ncbi:hypothetical protein E2C01_081335 [Portunus trituberculatus]|uniref:Uncharacterized protein n=1 Tax=Portunus trituberculatus TaxID=210409 RepID=A0A5B7IVJ7_PORTR|nr:hypothetical protein [Portunus trituberculatus]